MIQSSAAKIRQGIEHFKNDIHLSELLAGGSIAFILKIAGMVFSYIFILLVTRNFGAGAMGIFALSTTVLSVFSIPGKLGFDTALLRFIAEYSSQGRPDMIKGAYIKSMRLLVPISLLLSVMLYILSPYISKYVFHKEYLSIYFRIVSFALLPLVLININSQALRALKKIKEFSFFQNISNFLFASMFLAFLLVFTKQQSSPVVSYAIALLLGAVLSQVLWKKNAGMEKVQHAEALKLKDMLNVSLPMMLSGSMLFIMSWTDTIMLGMFRTEAEVGVYNVALKIAAFTSITLVAINSIAAPKFAEFYGKNDINSLGKVARQSTKLIFWTSFPIFLAVFFFPSFIMGIFGSEFKTGAYALLILTAGQFINAISGSVGAILQMTGKEKVFQNIMLTAVALNIILNAILIPKYGINGAAVSSSLSVIILNIVCVVAVRMIFKFNTMYLPVITGK